ncbi:MAG: iron-containing alcohol dehydrogenase [Endozoicomonas sp.]
MSATIWNFPTKMHFGAGVVVQLPALCRELGISRPLLVTDRGLKDLPFVQDMLEQCNGAGLTAALFGAVKGNPEGVDVDSAVVAFRQNGCDGVIAVGGGSALDVGKTVALVAGQKRSLWELGGGGFDWSWIADNDVLPLVAVPTTAGTGSEVGRSSVIIHEASQSKKIVFHPSLMPPVVLSDPELTVGLPPHITAATGIDAFVHCFEAYCAPGFHPMAEGIALEGMRLVAEALPRAFDQGDDVDARGKMLAAATMGATAFQKDLGGVHALAHPLGALYDIHHGLVNAILLPYVMIANHTAIAERMALPARVLGLEQANFNGLLDWVLAFRERLGIPHSLSETGISADKIAEVGQRAAVDPCAPGNPIPFTAEQYSRIFANALQGRLS